MSDYQADLRGLEPLEHLANELRSAPAAIQQQLTEDEGTLTPRLRRIERGAQAAQENLERAERFRDEVSSRGSDDGDDDGVGAELERAADEAVEEARERVERIERAMADVRDALSRYKAAARDLDSARTGAFPKAQAFLTEQVSAARAYLAVELGPGGNQMPDPSVRTRATSPARLQGSDAHGRIQDQTLPPGFIWLPLADVAQEDILDAPHDWEKVSKEVMTRGVRQLYGELLPILASNPAITRDELAGADRAAGRTTRGGLVHPDSLANLYDIFFAGHEPVSAELYADGFWRVNGRHRVSIARALGMTHIPAREQGRAK